MRPVYVYILGLWLCLAAGMAGAAEPPKTLKLFDQEVVLKHAANNERSAIFEYIPNDQTFDNWKDMVAVHQYKNIQDPFDFVKAFSESLKNTKNSKLYKVDKDDKGAFIVFLTFDGTTKENMMYEYNIWYFTKAKTQGIIAGQYAVRHYGQDKVDDFTKATAEDQEFTNKHLKYVAELPLDQFAQ